jgi:hypothetical protein
MVVMVGTIKKKKEYSYNSHLRAKNEMPFHYISGFVKHLPIRIILPVFSVLFLI